jgi:hypothetical protein
LTIMVVLYADQDFNLPYFYTDSLVSVFMLQLQTEVTTFIQTVLVPIFLFQFQCYFVKV